MKKQQELIFFFDDEFKNLLKKISPETKPIWGTMDAQRMIEHVTLAFKIANGKINISISAIDAKSDKLKKLFLLSDKPLPKHFQNSILPVGLQSYEHSSLEIAKQKLVDEINRYHAIGKQKFVLSINIITFNKRKI